MQAIMNAKDLKKLIEATKHTTGNGLFGKKMLQYIKLSFTKDEIKAVSLDGYAMSIEYCSCKADEDFTVLVKPFKVGRINSNAQAIIELKDDICLIYIDDSITGFKQPDLEFINDDELLKPYKENPPEYKAYFRGLLLLKALQEVKASIGDNYLKSDQVARMEFYGGHQGVLIKTGKKNVKLVLPCRYSEVSGDSK